MSEFQQTPESVKKHRYRVFLAIEILLLGLAVMATVALIQERIGNWVAAPLSILIMWHIVAIPICVMYLIGNPIVMTLAPIFPSAASRAFRKQLAQRPWLNDEEFFVRYCAESGIPREIAARLRQCLRTLDVLIEQAIPNDNLSLLYDELDFDDVLDLVEKEFGITFTSADYEALDGTLGNLLRLTYFKIRDIRC
jgi:hypothetical protein